MRTHTNKTAGQAVKGAGVPALPLIFPRVIADGKNKVRKSLAGRSPYMGELRGIFALRITNHQAGAVTR